MYDPVTVSMVASAVLDGLVVVVFAFRLWIRITMQRVGWEDIWATIAFVCGMLNSVSNWVYLIDLAAGRPSMTAMWIYMFTFSCLVWAVRISILYSILRIIPAQERLYAYGRAIIAFFLFCCLGIIVQKALVCGYANRVFTSTPSTPYARCNRLHSMSISELAVGSFADVITVVFPLYVLRSVTVSPRYLRLLRLLFSSTTMVSIVCALGLAFRVVPALSRWSLFVTDFQVATCLIVCNLLVVVTYLYRVLGCQKRRAAAGESDAESAGSEDSTPVSTSRQMTLTTIDLLFTAHAAGVSVASGESTMVMREV